MIDVEKLGIFGHLQIEEVCNETGISTMILDDKNRIVNTGFQSFLEVVSNRNQYQYGFGGIYLGDDVGNGSIDNPEPAAANMTPSDQNTIYEVLSKDIFIDHPAPNKVRFTAMVDGNELYKMDSSARLMFTSASIRNSRGEIVAYRRFSGRSASPLITLSIRWTITIEEQCDDIPSRYVNEILFYVMRELDPELISPDPINPVEVTEGIGTFTNNWDVARESVVTYVIPLIEWSDGTLEAIEFDGLEPITPNTTMTIDPAAASVSNDKPYILVVESLPPVAQANIQVCANGSCGTLSLNKFWKFDSTAFGMIPVGYHKKIDWPSVDYWKFQKTTGAIFGPESASGVYNPLTPDVWEYYAESYFEDGGTVNLVNSRTYETITKPTSGEPNHMSASFDQNMYPIMVWTEEDEMFVNWYDPSISQNTTTALGKGLSPYVINPAVNNLLVVAPIPMVIVYVDPVADKLVMRSQTSRWTDVILIEDDVTDIVSAGITTMNSMRIVYTKRVGNTTTVHSIGSERLGAFFSEASGASSIDGTVTRIGIVDSRLTVPALERSMIVEFDPIAPTVESFQFTVINKTITEKSIVVGIIPMETTIGIKDSITRLNDTFGEHTFVVDSPELTPVRSLIIQESSDTLGGFTLTPSAMTIEPELVDSLYQELPTSQFIPEDSTQQVVFKLDSETPMSMTGNRIHTWTDKYGEVVPITPNSQNIVNWVNETHRQPEINVGGIVSEIEVIGDWWFFTSMDVENVNIHIGGVNVYYSVGDGLRIIHNGSTLISYTSGNFMIALMRSGNTLFWNINDDIKGNADVTPTDVTTVTVS